MPASTSVANRPGTRTGAWLLVLALPAFVPSTLVTAAIVLPQQIAFIDDTSRAQFDAFSGGWLWISLSIFVALAMGPVGLMFIGAELRTENRGWGNTVLMVSTLAVAAALLGAVLHIAAGHFTEPVLSANPLYRMSESLNFAVMALAMIATSILCAGLHAIGRFRTAAVVFGIASAVLAFVVSLVPPFVATILWLALGVVLLRNHRRVPQHGREL